MIEYQLNADGTHAQRIVNGIRTGIWCCVLEHLEYLAWLESGNAPLPADELEVTKDE